MKFIAALALIGMTSTPAFAGHVIRGQKNVHYEEKCYKNVERYIPGYYDDFGNWKVGRVKTTRKRVPCFRSYRRPKPYIHEHHHHPDIGGHVDDNSASKVR